VAKRNSKGVISLILLILIALLVGGGAFYFIYKKQPVKIGQPSKTSEESKIPDDWLTYENSTYHYQINYPSDFHAQGENEPPYPAPPAGKSFSYRWDNNEYCDFGILVATDADGYSGEIENIRQQGNDVESQGTVDGVPAIIFDAMGGDAISRSYYLTKDNVHFRFGYNYRIAAKYSQDCADIVSLMVSSFKFVQ
jgi:hypothetical protein